MLLYTQGCKVQELRQGKICKGLKSLQNNNIQTHVGLIMTAISMRGPRDKPERKEKKRSHIYIYMGVTCWLMWIMKILSQQHTWSSQSLFIYLFSSLEIFRQVAIFRICKIWKYNSLVCWNIVQMHSTIRNKKENSQKMIIDLNLEKFQERKIDK